MPERPGLVSVIIPAYNAALYIGETIQSIYAQSYTDWEIIAINDGSTDNTPEILKRFSDKRITVINRENEGVASARNEGLIKSKGEFIVFFDADDLMSPEFLQSRVSVLKNNREVGFVGGAVCTFPISSKTRKAVASDPENEILFFDAESATVPSNYLIRKEILINNGLGFNKELSSTADRFFILEISKFVRGMNIEEGKGELLYRYSPESMSNNVTSGLILDNEKFYFELKRRDLLPGKGLQKFKSFYFLSLAIGFGMVKHWRRFVKYMVMSFMNHPGFFLMNFGKRIIGFSHLRSTKLAG